jgi:flagellar basal body P-ring formation protein FlgA
MKGHAMKVIFLSVLIAASPPAFEAPEQLDAKIAEFIGHTNMRAAPIDRRLRLAACEQPAAIEWNDSQSLAVRCTAPAWRLRVPLNDIAAPAAEDTRPLIRRGESVEARYEADDFDITATLIAMEDGRKGDVIRVKNPATGRASVGTVTGKGIVLLSP